MLHFGILPAALQRIQIVYHKLLFLLINLMMADIFLSRFFVKIRSEFNALIQAAIENFDAYA